MVHLNIYNTPASSQLEHLQQMFPVPASSQLQHLQQLPPVPASSQCQQFYKMFPVPASSSIPQPHQLFSRQLFTVPFKLFTPVSPNTPPPPPPPPPSYHPQPAQHCPTSTLPLHPQLQTLPVTGFLSSRTCQGQVTKSQYGLKHKTSTQIGHSTQKPDHSSLNSFLKTTLMVLLMSFLMSSQTLATNPPHHSPVHLPVPVTTYQLDLVQLLYRSTSISLLTLDPIHKNQIWPPQIPQTKQIQLQPIPVLTLFFRTWMEQKFRSEIRLLILSLGNNSWVVSTIKKISLKHLNTGGTCLSTITHNHTTLPRTTSLLTTTPTRSAPTSRRSSVLVLSLVQFPTNSPSQSPGHHSPF